MYMYVRRCRKNMFYKSTPDKCKFKVLMFYVQSHHGDIHFNNIYVVRLLPTCTTCPLCDQAAKCISMLKWFVLLLLHVRFLKKTKFAGHIHVYMYMYMYNWTI